MQDRHAFIIFPNQLFLQHLLSLEKKYDAIFLLEEPVYFYDVEFKHGFKPNKVKLAYLRACMKAYHSALEAKFKRTCTLTNYVEYNELTKHNGYAFLAEFESVSMFNPIDHDLMRKLKSKIAHLTVLPSPDLLLSEEQLREYFDKHKTAIRHVSFYEFVKKKLGILEGIPNLDKMNRSGPPKQPPKAYKYKVPRGLRNLYDEAVDYVNRQFPSHYGDTENVRLYPITHKTANEALKRFLKHSLPYFGTYQDAVMRDDPFMYHSILSPMLNVGLLTPRQVVDTTLQHYDKAKGEDIIPLSSFEGFLRQIVGWRTMMQGVYLFRHDDLVAANTPQNMMTFKDPTPWYKGETGILPVDEEIKKVISTGYAHHIVRLMMFMNFFILCELHPFEIYKWFMEVVSIDAYSWVMESNIYAMGYFYNKVMTKPYLSTSNYIVKMTDYKRDGHWDVIWNRLYREFVAKKPKEYTFFYKKTLKTALSEENPRIVKDFQNMFIASIK